MTRRELLAALAAAARKDSVSAADALLKQKTDSGEMESAALLVRSPSINFAKAYGRARLSTPFLLASITKPMTASGVMLLRDRGAFRLDDSVKKFIPEFRGGDRDLVTIEHLLTHTSGLPDMLPENVELRKRHAPLEDFVAGACRVPLLFKPGTKVSYQSMGILLAAAIAERITKQRLRDFLRAEIYTPLGMRDTSLGLGGRTVEQCARCQVPEPSDWDWNSTYWRDLGAPWGGAHATVADVAKFVAAFADPAAKPWKAGTTLEMRTIKTVGLDEAWGLGWSRNLKGFGERCSPATWGHSGSTGTLCWYDPAAKLTFVLLTSKPADQSRETVIRPVSDMVSALR